MTYHNKTLGCLDSVLFETLSACVGMKKWQEAVCLFIIAKLNTTIFQSNINISHFDTTVQTCSLFSRSFHSSLLLRLRYDFCLTHCH
jgi:hypothetical protein